MTEQKTKNRGNPLSTFFMVLTVLFCCGMIGWTSYAKFQLDRAENALATPDDAFVPEQELYQKTVLALGYSGFLGATQSFITTRDRAALGDMRMNYQTAKEATDRLGEKAPTGVRRDLDAILKIFAGIITKAEETDAMSAGVTSMDIMTAATSLSTLDARLRSALAATRSSSLETVKMWNLNLMLVAWLSLVLLGVVAVVSHIKLRNQNKDAINALMQSVQNMTDGDLEAPIWGQERRDLVGDMARALERARLYFAELPDLTLDSDEGPIRCRFDGESRSLFQSMIKDMETKFARVQQNTEGFSGAMSAQQNTVSSLVDQLKTTLTEVQGQATDQEETFNRLSDSLTLSAHTMQQRQEDTFENLSQKIERAALDMQRARQESENSLRQLVPFMQERAQNMAEVTQLAGRQVTQSLQSLVKAEGTLRDSANSSQSVVKQLADATNKMGERMFAALNLMQASGKHLTDTTQTVHSRFGEAIDTLRNGETRLQDIIERAESRLASTINAEENMASLAGRTQASAEKMERAVNNICERHEGLSEQVVTATHRMESIVASFDTAGRAMSDATAQVRRDGTMINSLLTDLRANNEQLLASIHKNSETNFNAVQNLVEKSHALMQRLEVQIAQQAQAAETGLHEMAIHSQSMAQHAGTTTSTLSQTISTLKAEQEKLAATRTRFTETISEIGTRFEQHATSAFGKTEQFAAQSFAKISGVAEQVEGMMQRLTMLSQLTGTLGTIAGQLGQMVPALAQLKPDDLKDLIAGTPTTVNMDETNALIAKQSSTMMHALEDQWHKAVVQIEAMHDQLAQIVVQQKDQLETRLVVMDKKLREATENLSELSDETGTTDDRQSEIINELVSALSKINEHVMELDDTIEGAGLKKQA